MESSQYLERFSRLPNIALSEFSLTANNDNIDAYRHDELLYFHFVAQFRPAPGLTRLVLGGPGRQRAGHQDCCCQDREHGAAVTCTRHRQCFVFYRAHSPCIKTATLIQAML